MLRAANVVLIEQWLHHRSKETDEGAVAMKRRNTEGVVMDDEVLEAKPYEHYWWDCPACGDVNDSGDIEPNGPEECESCGAEVVVRR